MSLAPSTPCSVRSAIPPALPGQNFGVSVAATDGLVVVGAPDTSGLEEALGTAWLFDGASGAVLSEIPNPSPDFEDYFGSPIVAVAGRAFITSPSGRSDDHGAVDVYAVGCGNGAVDEGETCDDGNAESGDGCDANCTPTACGNAIQTEGEACDDGNAENEDGCTNACRQNVCGDGIVYRNIEVCDDGNGIDGDGCDFNCRPSLCHGSVQLEHVRLTLQRLGGEFGDERAIFRARLPLPPDDFDPERDGLSVQVLDAEDPFGFGMNGVLELSPFGLFGAAIPPAGPDSGCGGPEDGWHRAGGLPRHVYRNMSGQWLGYGTPPLCFPIRARGQVEAVVEDRRSRGRALRIRVETRGPRSVSPRNRCTQPSPWAPRSLRGSPAAAGCGCRSAAPRAATDRRCAAGNLLGALMQRGPRLGDAARCRGHRATRSGRRSREPAPDASRRRAWPDRAACTRRSRVR